MSQEASAYSFLDQSKQTFAPKPTFAVLSEAMIDAAKSVDELVDASLPVIEGTFGKVKNQLFLSPRLAQWQTDNDEKGNKGYWLKSQDQTVTVAVWKDIVVLTIPDHDHPKYPFKYDIATGLPAQTLYKSIQDAQAIVQPRSLNDLATNDEGEEFFNESDPAYIESAGLDAALEETHAEPLVEDDAELIEEVTAETEEPKQSMYNASRVASERDDAELAEEVTSFTANANRKNSVTDGVECSYCGNLNRSAYKGTCPKCPKQTKEFASMIASLPDPVPPKSGRDSASEAWLMSRLKSLQGRVLTILDASPIADKAQRDAVKSLLNKEFRREMNRVSDGGRRAGNPMYEGE